MTPFKTPSRFMAGCITVVLLLLFGLSYLAPALNVSWIRADAKFDAALQQVLLAALMLAVGYYLGASQGGKENADALRQVAVASANLPPPDKPQPVAIVNEADNPVPVQETPKP